MSNDNVLSIVGKTTSLGAAADDNSILQSIATFLKDNDILLDWGPEDVDLGPPSGDERRLDKLTPLEQELFIIHSLVQSIVQEITHEVEASNTEAISKIVRDERVSAQQAVQMYTQRKQGRALEPETHELLMQAAYAGGLACQLYQFSLLSRVKGAEWKRRIIVREGFVAYSYE